MNGDYIKICRSLLDWEWYSDINTCRLFIHMILKANWKDGKFRGTTVPRGSFISSIENLAKETKLTKMEVRTAISHLKSTGEITSKSTSKYTVFTVVSYDLYQTTNKQDNNQATYEQHTNNIQLTTIEEGKKGRKKERNNNELLRSSCSEPKSEIELSLNDGTAYGVAKSEIEEWEKLYPAVDIMQELRKMKGWCDANPTKRKTARGIKRFINTWLSKEQDRGHARKEVNDNGRTGKNNTANEKIYGDEWNSGEEFKGF